MVRNLLLCIVREAILMQRLAAMVFLWLLCGVGRSPATAAAPERTWTIDGEPVVGRLIAYRDGEAMIETADGQTVRAHHSRLTREDMVHIQARRRLERRARQAARAVPDIDPPAAAPAPAAPPAAPQVQVQVQPAASPVVNRQVVYVPYPYPADPTWPVRWDLYRAYNGLDIWPFAYRGPGFYSGVFVNYPIIVRRPVRPVPFYRHPGRIGWPRHHRWRRP
jgi:hypothetical protein